MAWLVEEDGDVERLSERELREQLRDQDLSGLELARPEDGTEWRPLHDYPIFAEEVPHRGNPADAARWRKLREFGVHAAVYAGVSVAIGFAPTVLILWGIGLLFHGASASPAFLSLMHEGKIPLLRGSRPQSALPPGKDAEGSLPAAQPSPEGAIPDLPAQDPGRADTKAAQSPPGAGDAVAPTLEAHREGSERAGSTDRTGDLPAQIGRYRILGRLGEGGMGVVYRGLDEALDRPVAIKLLRPGGEAPRARERLRREARAMARLSHPGVVTVFDVGDVGADVFVAMELVEGPTLGAWLEEPKSAAEILRALAEAAEGVAAAHEADVVHRDFKPENVMIGRDGRARVLDFGLAKPTDGRESLTHTQAVLGTPRYMAPEQLRGEPADFRSDQFAIGVVVFEALYGIHPYEPQGDTPLPQAVLAGALREPPTRADVPPATREAILRAVSPQPDARHPSVRALLDALGPLPADRDEIAKLADSCRRMIARRSPGASEALVERLGRIEEAIAELDANAAALEKHLAQADPDGIERALREAREGARRARDARERDAATERADQLADRLDGAKKAQDSLASLRSRRAEVAGQLEALHLELLRAEADEAAELPDLEGPLSELRIEIEAAREVESLLRA